MHCPGCKSDQTQRLQVIYEGGTQDIDTTSSSVGIGVAGGAGLGSATTRTRGQSQSLLAQRVSPPQKKPFKGAVITAIAGAVGLLIGGGTMTFIGFALIAIGIFLGYQASQYNNTEWPPLHQNWLENWYCNKCGTVFHGAEATQVQALASSLIENAA